MPEHIIMVPQVIGELILSLSPEESERIFPSLYLPIVTEVRTNICANGPIFIIPCNPANLRIWYPWRYYMPTLYNYRYHQTLNKLNVYVEQLVRKRWADRTKGHTSHLLPHPVTLCRHRPDASRHP